VLRSISFYAQAFEISKIELLQNQRSVIATVYCMLFAIHVIAQMAFFDPLKVMFFPLTEDEFRKVGHYISFVLGILAMLPMIKLLQREQKEIKELAKRTSTS
jgi:hypothetical protein